jgi:hypothetical protein
MARVLRQVSTSDVEKILVASSYLDVEPIRAACCQVNNGSIPTPKDRHAFRPSSEPR